MAFAKFGNSHLQEQLGDWSLVQYQAYPQKIPALIFYHGIAHIGNCRLQQLAAPLKIAALIFYRDIAHAFEYLAYQ